MKKITPFMMKYVSNTNVIYSFRRFKSYHIHMLRHTIRRRYLYDECFDTKTEYSDWWIRIKYDCNKRLSHAQLTRTKTLRNVSAKLGR